MQRVKTMSQAVVTGLVLLACGAPAVALQERPPITVTLADGTTVALRGWTLSYEYLTWRHGTSQALAQAERRDTADLWLGKRATPTVGTTVELKYGQFEREAEVDGEVQKVTVPVARELIVLAADGKKTSLKPEPPSRDLLMPDGGKGLMVLPRSLDLRGETLTGTRREFCLVSFSSLVECSASPDHQVLKVEFPK
jgi:hypothetical protein